MPLFNGSQRCNAIAGLLVLAVFLLPVYLVSFNASWHYDDYHHILENQNLRNLSNIPLFFIDSTLSSQNPGSRMYRPLLLTTFALNGSISKNSTFGFHLVNFLFHLLASWGVYLLLVELLTGLQQTKNFHPAIPLSAAALFALHPLQVETVVYISARSSGMTTLLLVFSLFFYLKAQKTNTSRINLAISLSLFVLALMTKESAAVFPAMVLGLEWCQKQLKPDLRQRIMRVLPYFLLLAPYLVLRHVSLPRASLSGLGKNPLREYPHHLLTQARVFFTYIQKVLFPVNLSVDAPYRETQRLADPWAWVAVIGIVLLCVLAIRLKKSMPLVVFGVFWIGLGLLPTSLVRLKVILNDHRMYLPMVGVSIALAGLLIQYVHRKPGGNGRTVVYTCAFVILVLFAAGSFNRSLIFQTEETLWLKALKLNPQNHRALVSLGNHFNDEGNKEEAYAYFQRAVQVNPYYSQAFLNLGQLSMERGRLDEAEVYGRRAAELDGSTTGSLHFLADVLRMKGKTLEAEGIYRNILGKDPRNAAVWANFGNLMLELNRGEEALRSFDRAIGIDPGLPHPYYGRALILETRGQYRESVYSMEIFLRLWNVEDETARAARAFLARTGPRVDNP